MGADVTPHLLWYNSTRAELQDVLQNSRLSDEEDGPLLEPFAYSAHEGLVSVGGVYIHIYNEQPEFTIENPQQFILELLKFIQEQIQLDMTPDRVEHITLALSSIANVIIKNPGVEIQCIGQFGLIFGLLSARSQPRLQNAALQAVRATAGSRECVEDVAASGVLGHLVALLPVAGLARVAIPGAPDVLEVLAALSALLANTTLVKEALAKGAVIYLLDLFCNSKLPETREAAVELLARMMADKLHGPKVRLTISRYVPGVFAEAMREGGAASAVHMFDAQHEHPELVWSEDTRAAVARTLSGLRDRHQSSQVRDANSIFEERETLERTSAGDEAWAPAGEVVVGGVYLKLFLQHPHWNLRSPKKFLQELLTETLNALSKDTTEDRETLERTSAGDEAWAPAGEVVVGGVYLKLFLQHPHWNLRSPKKFLQELLTETLNALSKDTTEGSRGAVCAAALAALVRARPHLGGACASYGELPRLARLLPACPEHAVPVLHALVQAQACVVALSSTDVMAGLKAAMKACPEVVGVACEALATIFNSSCNTDRLVNQAIETDLITELLSLLETRLDGQTAAQLVSALKAMARCPTHAERVRALLARSRVWEQYSQQRHDLFIAATPQHHSIAGAPHTAGYLTAPPASIPAQPPPID